jgi:hypothetical protein
MHKNCAESTLTIYDLLVRPDKTISVIDKKGNEYKIKEIDIFYIECKNSDKNNKDKRDIKIIYLCYPTEINNRVLKSIEWRTILSLTKIIEKLGEHGFVQINKKTIVRSLLIQGRDSDWKYIQIIGYNGMNILEPEKYQTKELPIGRIYKDSVIKTIKALSLIETKNFNSSDALDLIYVNPINIIYIQFTKEVKTIYLSNPYSSSGRNCFEVTWKNRMSAQETIKYFKINSLVQVNRNIIINLYCVVGKFGSYQKIVTVRYNNLIEKSFKVGKNYYQKIIEGFS